MIELIIILEIAGFGELMLASFFKPGNNPTGWYELFPHFITYSIYNIFNYNIYLLYFNSFLLMYFQRFLLEKYDGIRGLWDPVPKRFFSRQGKILKVRNDFEETMPDLLLDGEIWYTYICSPCVSISFSSPLSPPLSPLPSLLFPLPFPSRSFFLCCR